MWGSDSGEDDENEQKYSGGAGSSSSAQRNTSKRSHESQFNGNRSSPGNDRRKSGPSPMVPYNPIEDSKKLIFNILRSNRLRWHKNAVTKTWEIVFLLNRSKHLNYWVACNAKGNYFHLHRDQIHDMLPLDTVTVEECLAKLLNALTEMFTETAVESCCCTQLICVWCICIYVRVCVCVYLVSVCQLFQDKPVMCEYQTTSYFGFVSNYFELTKIHDYHIDARNQIDGVYVAPYGEAFDEASQHRELSTRKVSVVRCGAY